MAKPLIQAFQLARVYRTPAGETAGVREATFAIEAGQVALLRGASGSGKTTLLSLLAGLDTPTSGSLAVAGHDMTRATGPELTMFRRSVVGVVFQSFNLMPSISVLENVCLPALLAGKPYAKAKARAMEHLDWLGMSPRALHLPDELSGGEMQRTAIARALINDPPVILADEPTGNLDSVNGAMVMDLLSRLGREAGRAVVIATHGDLAGDRADLTLCMADGVLGETAREAT
jgi:ABC-type lipoprotein export system ATPase subunit